MAEPKTTKPQASEQPANLKVWEGSSAYVRQGRHWSSALIWTFSALFGCTLIWAFTAKLDQTVTAAGRLRPAGSVRAVESPSAGVVSEVFVRDGVDVNQGDPLFSVEAKGLASRRQAITDTLRLLELQAGSIQSILSSDGDPERFQPLPPLPDVQDQALKAQLITARQQVEQLRSSLEQLATRLASRRETMKLNQLIADDLKPLYESGAMARNQYLLELNRVQEIKADVATLEEEQTRKLGEAATQLDAINKQTIQLKAQLVALKEDLAYRTVRAPINGRVFDAKVSPMSVVNADQEVLKLVPARRLEARVSISDSDIGFVKVGMPVNVSVNSFPSGEYGYISGTLSALGSDVLKPDREQNAFRFPATVTLDEQTVESGDEQLNLQSGMSVTALIKLRSRPAITVVTDLFTKQFEGVQRFR